MNYISRLIFILFAIPALLQGGDCRAQALLDKQISIEAKKKPLGDVLDAISRQGHFYFSYNAGIINKDSLVTIAAHNKTVRQTLELLLGADCQYKETDNHIIIQPAEKEKWYTISGYITDAVSGQSVADASVYERQQLAVTLTDINGYFKLQLKYKDKYAAAEITVSKGFYKDTSLTLIKGHDQSLVLSLQPADHTLPDITITQYSNVEKSWFGKFLFPAKLKKQSANLSRFFVNKPIQFSFTPGLGSHGKMSGQVTNKFSFNALGGYSAGVDGFELGGLFNIDKKDVQYVQIAGIFNIVSGSTNGVQIGGIANTVQKSAHGVQISGITGQTGNNADGVIIAGINSRIRGHLQGLQISGIANVVEDNDSTNTHKQDSGTAMKGMQIAGVANIVNGKAKGFELAGVANINRGDVHGVQLSSVINFARKLEGTQIGLVNIADTVTGYSIGIFNIVKKGYHTISVSTNEIAGLNVAYKSGNKKLYSIVIAAASVDINRRVYLYGYGAGKQIDLGKKLALCMELTGQHLFMGDTTTSWPFLLRFDPILSFRIVKTLKVFLGPSMVFSPSLPTTAVEGYIHGVPPNALHNFKTGGSTAAWIGWQVGLSVL